MRSPLMSLVILVAVCAAAAPPAPGTLSPQLVLASPYIFRGTVIRSGATATVRVDEIYRGAATIGDFTGQEIFVERPEASERREAVFFATPVAYGKTVTVRALGETDAAGDALAVRKQIAAIERQDDDRRLLARLRTADAVVTAHVIDVTPLERERRPFSEHDPEWMVARVAVRKPLAGKPAPADCGAATPCTRVVFAGSRDVVWVMSPKLKEGEDALLLLRREEPALQGEVRPKTQAYVLVAPGDLRPLSDTNRVIALLAMR